MPTIKILPSGQEIECEPDTPIFEYGQKENLDIETACVGKGTCGLCRIKIVSGEENLSEQTEKEIQHLGNVYYINKVRLACQTKVTDGLVEIEILHKKKRTKPTGRGNTRPPQT